MNKTAIATGPTLRKVFIWLMYVHTSVGDKTTGNFIVICTLLLLLSVCSRCDACSVNAMPFAESPRHGNCEPGSPKKTNYRKCMWVK